jgi:cysteine desulfurase
VASIVGFGKACELAQNLELTKKEGVKKLRDRFEEQVFQKIEGIQINGDTANRLPNTTNLAFDRVDGEALLMLLDERNVACSAGSACTSGSVNPSHVLKAMGCSDTHARSSLRFSFSHYNTEQEVDTAVGIIEKAVSKIRAL